MNIYKKLKTKNKGFTLVEVAVVVAAVVVMLAIIAPALINYTEQSRMQKDMSATDELVSAFQRALIESDVLDESLRYEIGNNFLTYTS